MIEKAFVFVLFSMNLGGAEKRTATIANHFAKLGKDVSIIVLDNDRVDYDLDKRIKVIYLPPHNVEKSIAARIFQKARFMLCRLISPRSALYMDKKEYLKKRYADKLSLAVKDYSDCTFISFMTYPNIALTMTDAYRKNRIIMTECTSPHYEFDKDSPENALKRKYYKRAWGFAFQTDEQKDYYSFLKNVEKRVIMNPVKDPGSERFAGERRKEIVNFCKLVPVKNLKLLFDAFDMFHKDHDDYSLTVYGEGPQHDELIEYISHLDSAESISIKPYVQNVGCLVADSAMFVSSSDREGVSNSMLEALALGIPSICTDCPAGGAKMCIEPYENGIIVPTGDKTALYEAMKYIAENPCEAEKFSEKSVLIREKYSEEQILRQWEKFVSNE